MNILFAGKRHDENHSGIELKMTGQIEGLKFWGHKVSYLYARKDSILLKKADGTDEEILHYKENWISIWWAYEEAMRRVFKKYKSEYDMCYIRKSLTSPMHLGALKEIKKHGVKIVEEIPTYPYDAELLKAKGPVPKIYYLIDVMGRKKLKKYLDYFVTFSEDKEIWGVKTIGISNGIDCDAIAVKEKSEKKDNTIHMLTVSTMQFWHGYDRLIRGLREYYDKKEHDSEVYLEMIGDGPERKNWESLTKELNLEKYVRFHGAKSGQGLTDGFNQCDLAVSSLGLHRLELEAVMPLKTREYIARGIPAIYTGRDLSLPKDLVFVKEIAADETPVNINEILDFYKKANEDKDLIQTMRNFAQENLTWKKQMKMVLETVEK